ncbi:unnamed protein product [Mycena citricolor]|uniref:Uncharacterized protein n=1 Tax=Mycena citricolor TaxID=2018698 RepID=A0AAD2K7P5_9AGAR|nr:unnamed protein product [Mycena citricolor]
MPNHVLRQLQLLVPGAALTYYLETPDHLLVTLSSRGWGRTAALASLGLEALTIVLFVYIFLTPWIHGESPNVRHLISRHLLLCSVLITIITLARQFRSWRASGVLSSVIPILTFSIVTGWLGMVATLGQTSMGYPRAVVGTSAIYAATFGLLGLIPAPSFRRSSQSRRPD